MNKKQFEELLRHNFKENEKSMKKINKLAKEIQRLEIEFMKGL